MKGGAGTAGRRDKWAMRTGSLTLFLAFGCSDQARDAADSLPNNDATQVDVGSDAESESPRDPANLLLEQIGTSDTGACVVGRAPHGTREVWCWNRSGVSEPASIYHAYWADDATLVDVGGPFAAAVRQDGSAVVWEPHDGVSADRTHIAAESPILSISVSDGIICVATGAAVLCGDPTAAASLQHISGPEAPEFLVTGGALACAGASGRLSCWGQWPHGVLEGPTEFFPNMHVIDATIGTDSVCALARDGVVACVGDQSAFSLDGSRDAAATLEPIALSRLPALADIGGRAPMCGHSRAHQLICFGAGVLGGGFAGGMDRIATAFNDQVLSVSSSGHSCALTDSATIRCWGRVGSGEFSPFDSAYLPHRVETHPRPDDVVLGGFGGCARSGDDVGCWGSFETSWGQPGPRVWSIPRSVQLPGLTSFGAGWATSIAAGDGTTVGSIRYFITDTSDVYLATGDEEPRYVATIAQGADVLGLYLGGLLVRDTSGVYVLDADTGDFSVPNIPATTAQVGGFGALVRTDDGEVFDGVSAEPVREDLWPLADMVISGNAGCLLSREHGWHCWSGALGVDHSANAQEAVSVPLPSSSRAHPTFAMVCAPVDGSVLCWNFSDGETHRVGSLTGADHLRSGGPVGLTDGRHVASYCAWGQTLPLHCWDVGFAAGGAGTGRTDSYVAAPVRVDLAGFDVVLPDG